jgi:biofilm PGA synthesis N-glycosyltransferase PgaC
MMAFISIVFVVYILAVFALAFGWARSVERRTGLPVPDLKVAVIVPFRNEAANLPELIHDLRALQYPEGKLEFILVDDHSDDTSCALALHGFAADPRFRLLELSAELVGKKSAIATAIDQTDAGIIVTTDADCRLHKNWISVITRGFSEPKIKMVVGGVRLTDSNFFGQLQALEFSSLVGTAGATLSFGIASMCNGANLAFRRESFLEVGGYRGNDAITSGDDDFLMRKFQARWKNGIQFMEGADGVVVAQASATVSDFVMQRLRWAGKWRADFSKSSIIALAVLAFHCCNIVLFASWLMGVVSSKVFVILAGSKLFADLIFLLPVCAFLRLRWRWTAFIVLQFVHSFYVVGVGFLSQILATRWKGRKVITGGWTGIS